MTPEANSIEFRNITCAEFASVLKKVKASIWHRALIYRITGKPQQRGTLKPNNLCTMFNLVPNTVFFQMIWNLRKSRQSTRVVKSLIVVIIDPFTYIISIVAKKLLEKVIHDQVFDFLQQNTILATQHSGFRPPHSTKTTLLHAADQCVISC